MIYISHRLDEVFSVIADRITVLRDGGLVDTMPRRDVNRRRLISLMVGRNMESCTQRRLCRWAKRYCRSTISATSRGSS
ncbi:MAG: hypothetical protein U0521_03305 [Anaerolineae bacterium]